MPRIVLEGVSKSFAGTDGKSVKAVGAVTLEVGDRELLALVGPSGCGKTTMLRLIAGLETADEGKIFFDEQCVTKLPPAERNVAMVFQSHALFPHLTAFENIAFGLKLRHVSQPEINARVREMADWLGLASCLDRKPSALSGGERQRVALGRALIRRPKILLLDEPLSHLDEPLRIEMRAELLALRSRLDMTLIYVTHDQAEALSLGDRVAVLHQGSLQQIGKPREIYEAPANLFVAGFIGSPPMNLFHGTIVRGEGGLILVADPASVTPAFALALGDWRAEWFGQNVGRQVVVGLRPECIQLADEKAGAGQAVIARVQSVQYTGVESIIRLAVGERGILSRVGSRSGIQIGQSVGLAFDLDRARIYDSATGKALF